ncbi:hypothetical protein L6270_04985 [Candidatus Parcubacteria bacterium]|nr:hypothetical protein [Patescibacteria group bacterium]MBU4309316.1 hypothetical protein [Patescibacteria group bacterium]MBU4432293.1 hypothetical protein [Patescibacteria group bacterium]MBU4577677.1 hypothetical protein [Patescibacteria group bacterium]MCG2697363.1 hypothetical protein [Candidatus Parcubacteria bacterium]
MDVGLIAANTVGLVTNAYAKQMGPDKEAQQGPVTRDNRDTVTISAAGKAAAAATQSSKETTAE